MSLEKMELRVLTFFRNSKLVESIHYIGFLLCLYFKTGDKPVIICGPRPVSEFLVSPATKLQKNQKALYDRILTSYGLNLIPRASKVQLQQPTNEI